MDRKTKAIVAAVAGASLLIGGGGTWAMWSDEAEVEGAQVTSGSMELTIDGPTTWYDVSSDRADGSGVPINVDGLFQMYRPPVAPASTGRQVDPATYRVVPGDLLVGATKFSIEAEGDNIAYALKIAPSEGSGFEEFALLDETGSPVSLVKAPNGHYVVAPEGSGDDGFKEVGDVVVELADPEAVKGWTLLVGLSFPMGVEAGTSFTAPSVVLSAVQVRPFDVEFDKAYDVILTSAPDNALALVEVIAELMGLPTFAVEGVVQAVKEGARVGIVNSDDEGSANAAKAALENAGGGVEIVVRATWPS